MDAKTGAWRESLLKAIRLCKERSYTGDAATLEEISKHLLSPQPVVAKPFEAPGEWFAIDVLGNPMREYEINKWETARWPSAQLAGVSRTSLVDDRDGENRPLRSFLSAYGSLITVGQMKEHMELAGWDKLWPDWINDVHGNTHLTKGGAQNWIRYLFELEKK